MLQNTELHLSLHRTTHSIFCIWIQSHVGIQQAELSVELWMNILFFWHLLVNCSVTVF
jgi:hypothetical protein